jgi:hypothetical protein
MFLERGIAISIMIGALFASSCISGDRSTGVELNRSQYPKEKAVLEKSISRFIHRYENLVDLMRPGTTNPANRELLAKMQLDAERLEQSATKGSVAILENLKKGV